MKVIDTKKLPSSRRVKFHAGVSNRILLDSDKMGYTLTKTVIHPEAGQVFQHYKNHLESCYCVSGHALLINAETGEEHHIKPDVTYVLDNHDPHYFEAFEETVLICVFNPPLTGNETHQEDGSYASSDPLGKELGLIGMGV
jgi:L-ectoine synthase